MDCYFIGNSWVNQHYSTRNFLFSTRTVRELYKLLLFLSYFTLVFAFFLVVIPVIPRGLFPRKIPRVLTRTFRGIDNEEFITRYELIKEKGRCHNDLIMCLVF